MRRIAFLTAVSAVALFAIPANAADWNGVYIGAHAGWATGGWDGNLGYNDPAFPNVTGKDVFGDTSKKLDTDGLVGGGQVGLNLQSGSIVYGLEVDATFADLEESGAFPTKDGSMRWDLRAKVDAFGSVRARLGYLVTTTVLLYGTGGLAWAKAEIDQNVYNVVPPPDFQTAKASADETHVGWVAGLGGEFRIADNWSVRAEWLHFDLGDADYGFKGTNLITDGPHTTDSFDSELDFDVFRVGAVYRFGVSQ